jgi:hypothetical protein
MLVRVSLQITMREVARWNIVTPAPVGRLLGFVV